MGHIEVFDLDYLVGRDSGLAFADELTFLDCVIRDEPLHFQALKVSTDLLPKRGVLQSLRGHAPKNSERRFLQLFQDGHYLSSFTNNLCVLMLWQSR